MNIIAFRAAVAPIDVQPFDLDREVEQVYQNFPQLRDRVFFIEVDGDKARLVRSGTDNAQKIDALNSVPSVRSTLSYFVQNGTAGCMLPLANAEIILLRKNGSCAKGLVPSIKSGDRYIRNPNDLEYSKYFTLDHEVGHAICWMGTINGKLAENTADGYGSLRHIQRFGLNTGFLSVRMEDVSAFLFADNRDKGEHFTAPVIEKIMQEAETFDFSKLSPRDTRVAASRYARTYGAHEVIVNDMHENYAIGGGEPLAALRSFADKILKEASPEAFKWGSLALQCFLDDKLRLSKQTEAIPDDSDWRSVRKILELRQAEFDICHEKIFFGLESLRPEAAPAAYRMAG